MPNCPASLSGALPPASLKVCSIWYVPSVRDSSSCSKQWTLWSDSRRVTLPLERNKAPSPTGKHGYSETVNGLPPTGKHLGEIKGKGGFFGLYSILRHQRLKPFKQINTC